MNAELFLNEFVPQVSAKETQLNKAIWLMETTGQADAGDLKASLETELRLLYSDPEMLTKLLEWEESETNPLLKRQINVLRREFTKNCIPKELIHQIAEKEAKLALSYANFRAELDGKHLSENEIRELLKTEKNPQKREQIWEASKQIGNILAPQILALVTLRNEAAQSVGYENYFTMQLALEEVDVDWLLQTFKDFHQHTETAYTSTINTINQSLKQKYQVTEVGPWAWSDPFCQEDPLDSEELDELAKDVDIIGACTHFYDVWGFDVRPVLSRSDMYERPGKNQHAFCFNIDRQQDVRTLNNIKPTLKWLETLLHELGHAVYELGYDPKLPWILRKPAHTLTTEAMALFAGRQAYIPESLKVLNPNGDPKLFQKAHESLKRRQRIFSRWVLVMTSFEYELYANPKQDLNKLWWQFVSQFQKIGSPKNREKANDWAAKYHMGLAPAYYYSYLLGEFLASSLKAGTVKDKLFFPGDSKPWLSLVEDLTGKPFSYHDWSAQFI